MNNDCNQQAAQSVGSVMGITNDGGGRGYLGYLGAPVQGTFMVWVLQGPNGYDYAIGENAVPPPARLHQVIARLGPFAWEKDQGLDRVRNTLNIGIAHAQDKRQREEADQRMRAIVAHDVLCEIERRARATPTDAEPNKAQTEPT